LKAAHFTRKRVQPRNRRAGKPHDRDCAGGAG
jgi:hypothetical protein